jgi:polyhydroxybutyrate depolymerase
VGRRVVRSYRLYVPPGVGSGSSVPLLVSLHGLGANGAIQDAATGWSSFDATRAAAGSPFIVAFPDGRRSLWFWGAERSYDAAFIFSVIASIEGSGCVDPADVYVDGWSEGAFMAQRMACANGDPAVDDEGVRLAAVASYAGGFPAVLPDCGPADRPVVSSRVLLSQGLRDRLVSVARLGFPAVRAWAARWGCAPPAAPGTPAVPYRHIQRLVGCRAHAEVVWWPISGFGHFTWSCPADRFWHNEVVWAFLRRDAVPTSDVCPTR